MISDYEVVCGHDIWELKAKVREMIRDEWQPFNELQVATPVLEGKVIPYYSQVMVKTAE